ncbi:MAG: hypothetical protein ABII82_03555 [Verrucomicrobiota bacterium]
MNSRHATATSVRLLSLLLLAVAGLDAAELHWSRGDGTWPTADREWTIDGRPEAWTEAAGAVLTGPGGDITVHHEGVTVDALRFESAGYRLLGDGAVTFTRIKSDATLVDFAAGAGSTIVDTRLIIRAAPSKGGITATIANRTARALQLNGALTVDRGDAPVPGDITLLFASDDPNGTIRLNAGVRRAPGTRNVRLGFTGPGTIYLNQANHTDAGGFMDEGTLMVGAAGALGEGPFSIGPHSATTTAMTLYTNGPVTIGNPIETKGNDHSRHTLGGATRDVSRFSGQIKLSGRRTPVRFVAVAGGRVDFTGQILNRQPMTKAGAGIVTLAAGNSTNSGPVTVEEGALLLLNTEGSATGRAPVTVRADAVLGGTGHASGPVTADDPTAVLPPGDIDAGGIRTVGVLTLGGGLAAPRGLTLACDLDGASADRIDLGAGPLDLGGTVTLNLHALGPVHAGNVYTLATGTGQWSRTKPVFVLNAPKGYAPDPAHGDGTGCAYDPAARTLTVQLQIAAPPGRP